MIEMGKTYRTRDGREVRIYAVDGGGTFPVHGAVKNKHGVWASECWDNRGHAHYSERLDADLIEVKPTITRTYWLLHFDTSFAPIPAYGCESAKDAITRTNSGSYGNSILAITGPHEITFTEGEGLSSPHPTPSGLVPNRR